MKRRGSVCIRLNARFVVVVAVAVIVVVFSSLSFLNLASFLHRELQNRLSDIFSHYSGLLAGGLSKQITQAKENITSDFDKLDEKLNEIFRKVVVLQSHSDALKNDALSTALLSPSWMVAFLTFSLLCMQIWRY